MPTVRRANRRASSGLMIGSPFTIASIVRDPRTGYHERDGRRMHRLRVVDLHRSGTGTISDGRGGLNSNVCILSDRHNRVTGMLAERGSYSRLSDVAFEHRKAPGSAVVLQNDVLANFQPVPPIWPQGARFCADNTEHVKNS